MTHRITHLIGPDAASLRAAYLAAGYTVEVRDGCLFASKAI